MKRVQKPTPSSVDPKLAEASESSNKNRHKHSFTLSDGNRRIQASGWGLVALVVISFTIAAVFVQVGVV